MLFYTQEQSHQQLGTKPRKWYCTLNPCLTKTSCTVSYSTFVDICPFKAMASSVPASSQPCASRAIWWSMQPGQGCVSGGRMCEGVWGKPTSWSPFLIRRSLSLSCSHVQGPRGATDLQKDSWDWSAASWRRAGSSAGMNTAFMSWTVPTRYNRTLLIYLCLILKIHSVCSRFEWFRTVSSIIDIWSESCQWQGNSSYCFSFKGYYWRFGKQWGYRVCVMHGEWNLHSERRPGHFADLK